MCCLHEIITRMGYKLNYKIIIKMNFMLLTITTSIFTTTTTTTSTTTTTTTVTFNLLC